MKADLLRLRQERYRLTATKTLQTVSIHPKNGSG
jgi:hypothetical protein